ncbi:MAG: UbiA family prenyltransferase [Methanoregulaceae archaeon]
MNRRYYSTLNLLNSSTVVAISGSLRLHIAFLFAGLDPHIGIYLAYGLIVYATYTLDRALGCEEDAINRSELAGADKRIGILACFIAFFIGFIILARENIYFASFFPFVIGYIYSQGISFRTYSLKLKGGAGRKNAVIGLTWGGSIALIVSRWNMDPVTLASIFLFFCLKLFISSTLFDFKDVDGDLRAGIRTLPIYLGESMTKTLLLSVCVLLHTIMAVSVIVGKIHPEISILLCSFLFGVTFISVYSISFEKCAVGIKKYFRVFMAAGELPFALMSRLVFAGSFL